MSRDPGLPVFRACSPMQRSLIRTTSTRRNLPLTDDFPLPSPNLILCSDKKANGRDVCFSNLGQKNARRSAVSLIDLGERPIDRVAMFIDLGERMVLENGWLQLIMALTCLLFHTNCTVSTSVHEMTLFRTVSFTRPIRRDGDKCSVKYIERLLSHGKSKGRYNVLYDCSVPFQMADPLTMNV
jgi:hypothetical protein